MNKIKIIIQEINEQEEVQCEVSVVSSEAPDNEVCHEEYLDLASQLIEIMDDCTINMDAVTTEDLIELEEEEETNE